MFLVTIVAPFNKLINVIAMISNRENIRVFTSPPKVKQRGKTKRFLINCGPCRNIIKYLYFCSCGIPAEMVITLQRGTIKIPVP